MRRRILLVLCFIGCSSLTQSARLQSSCRPVRGDPLRTIGPTDWPQLAGEFRLIQVNDADSTMRPHAFQSRLILHIADSTERTRARARQLAFQSSDYQLAGVRRSPTVVPSGFDEEPAELAEAILYLGCRNCNDASPDRLRIHQITASGFVGRWGNGQTGIARIVYSNGKPAPDPSGYFCAKRVVSPISR